LRLVVVVVLAGTPAAVADVLIPVWVERGDPIEGLEQSISVLQILAFVVVVRTWMAMPTTLLKATGHHRAVARASAVAGVASVLLSIALVETVGLIGAAIGAAVPAAALAATVIFPRACRVVGLTMVDGYRQIVWPALWPMAPVMAGLAMTRFYVPPHLLLVLGHLGLGALLYAGLFLAAGIDREERRWMRAALASARQRGPQELAAA
jgi:O-antigen/teichoic acid export membrane protein